MKKKILFVVDTLAQHGAERYLYEIVKVLSKTDVQMTVCSLAPLHGHHSYYVEKLRDLGVEVLVLPLDLYQYAIPIIIKKVFNSLAYRVVNKIKANYIHNRIMNNVLSLSRNYDVVSIIKWEVYTYSQEIFDRMGHKKIHIMSSIYQYSTFPYQQLPKGKTDFVIYYPGQRNEVLNGRNEEYRFFDIPLLLDNEQWPNYYSPKNDNILRIGIFSRIHYDQPTSFIFSIVHDLKSKGVSVELYFFGRYYDEKFYKYYLKTVEILKISNEVKFVGHTDDIAEAIRANHLDIGVMNSVNELSGYSGIEIQSYGLPVVFFNITGSGYSSNKFPYVCNSVSEVSNTIKSLWDKDELKSLSKQTFYHTKKEYGIKSNESKILDCMLN